MAEVGWGEGFLVWEWELVVGVRVRILVQAIIGSTASQGTSCLFCPWEFLQVTKEE
jgi:hypothetical protein